MTLSDTLSNIESVLTSVAIVIGGAWTYFHYFKGRIYKPRLEPNVVGKVRAEPTAYYLLVTSHLKNVGLSKLTIQQEGSAIRVFACNPISETKEVESADWTHLATFSVFERHSWIEPGELIEDHQLITIPRNSATVVRVDLRVVSRGISWEVSEIIALEGTFEIPK